MVVAGGHQQRGPSQGHTGPTPILSPGPALGPHCGRGEGPVGSQPVGSSPTAEETVAWILPFTSGGFLYIALVNVLPDILEEDDPW